MSDGYQSSIPLNTTSSHFTLSQCSSNPVRLTSLSIGLATLAPNKMRSNAYTIESIRHMERHILRCDDTLVVSDTNIFVGHLMSNDLLLVVDASQHMVSTSFRLRASCISSSNLRHKTPYSHQNSCPLGIAVAVFSYATWKHFDPWLAL